VPEFSTQTDNLPADTSAPTFKLKKSPEVARPYLIAFSISGNKSG
jgi:hypothetical protein